MKIFRFFSIILFLSSGIILGGLFLSNRQNGFAAGDPISHDYDQTYQQRKTLFLMIDRLDNSNPTLRCVWLIIALPGNSKLTFLPIFPSISEQKESVNQSLTTSFKVKDDGSLSDDFSDVLKSMDIQWQDYVILDDLALAGFVDLLDGIGLSSGPVSNDEMITGEYINRIEKEYQLFYQAELLGELCRSIPLLSLHPDLDIAISNLMMHSNSSINLTEFRQDVSDALRSETSISCQFPSIKSFPYIYSER